MPDLEVKSVKLLGTPVNYAYAVKAGPWIFLTGHEAFDFASGIAEEVAGPPGFPRFGRPRSRREGDFILGRMRRILREFGSDLGYGVRLDQFYPNPAAVAAYHLARHAEFGDYIPPRIGASTMPRSAGLLRRMRAGGGLTCPGDPVDQVWLPVDRIHCARLAWHVRRRAAHGSPLLGINRPLCLDGERRIRGSRLKVLRHGRRGTRDRGQHDGRISQSFHHITFIVE